MRLRLSRLALALTALAVGLAVPLAFAGTSSLSYTAGQSTAIQNQLIPRYNADHCRAYGLPTSCASADLAAAGCSSAAATIKTVVQDSCTIFTSDATGEAAFLKEVANVGLIFVFNRLIQNDNASYNAAECTRFKGLSQANQNTECTLRGLASGCSGPCP